MTLEAPNTVSIQALQRRPKAIDEDIVIGKDVLELLTGAMYADPLTVYREYVQNCADALDDSKDCGHDVSKGPQVSIWLDQGNRTVRIRDIGIGVSNAEFVRRLTAIGASGKRGKSRRGFRGVGRLSGLGYCQELVFRSRSSNSEKVKELRWDSRALRSRLRDATYDGSLADLVREVATVTLVADGSHYPDHFFEVEMVKVMRIRNDLLMNEDEIRRYLAEVAPVPFSPQFTLGGEIASWLAERGLYSPLHIELNDDKGPIFHRAVSELAPLRQAKIWFSGIEFVEIQNSGGELLAAGWLLEHEYSGAIPKASRVGGVRLRCRGVQVGGDDILAPLFVEPRFASWGVGDLHIVHPRIVPNGRRDEFEVSAAYGELQDELKAMAKRLTHTIRSKSDARRVGRRTALTFSQIDEWLSLAKDKKLHETTRRVAIARAAHTLKDAERIARKVPVDGGLHTRIQLAEKSIARMCLLLTPPKRSGRPAAAVSKGAHAAVEAILTSTTQTKRSIAIAEQVLAALEGRTVRG